MKTIIELQNSNCPRCHNDMLGALREREGVERVRSDFASGCLVVDHEVDPTLLVSLIQTEGRAVAVADNGERMMVCMDGHEAPECHASKTLAGGGRDEEGDAVASGSASSQPGAPRGLLDARANGPRGGRAGVRVVSREPLATGPQEGRFRGIIGAVWGALKSRR